MDRLSQLETLLAEKDQLVTALTVQLEEAAERLDRVQRSGGDRGPRLLGGMPRELVEEQRALVEDLQRAVQQWEEFHAAAALGRIEMQIGELRDLVASRVTSGGLSPGYAGDDRPASLDRADHRAGHRSASLDDDAEEEPAPEQGGAAAWEALKASLLQNGREEAPHAAPASVESLPDDEPIEALPPPEPVDLAQASREALCEAIEQRDVYIAHLIRRVRSVDLRATRLAAAQPGDTPEEVAARLAELEAAFQQQQRMLEIEMSLERARLGREEARLRQLEAQIQKEMKRLGLHGPDGRHGAQTSDAGEPTKGRWRRLLGMGANE